MISKPFHFLWAVWTLLAFSKTHTMTLASFSKMSWCLIWKIVYLLNPGEDLIKLQLAIFQEDMRLTILPPLNYAMMMKEAGTTLMIIRNGLLPRPKTMSVLEEWTEWPHNPKEEEHSFASKTLPFGKSWMASSPVLTLAHQQQAASCNWWIEDR